MTADYAVKEDATMQVEYIEDMLQQLIEIAAGGDHKFLVLLLEIAHLEAESILLAGAKPAQ